MKDPQDDFRENPTRQSILHFFPLPFTCFCFGDFLTFFTWQPLFFLVYDWFGSPSPLFFPSSHPELSFVQVSKSHPEKLETELQHTAEDSNQSPDMFVASYVNHIAIASHILTVTFNAISFCKNLMFLFMLASFDHNVSISSAFAFNVFTSRRRFCNSFPISVKFAFLFVTWIDYYFLRRVNNTNVLFWTYQIRSVHRRRCLCVCWLHLNIKMSY